MVLKNFEKLAHVGGVVCPSDDERLKNLFKYLSEQIEERRERLLEAGVSSYTLISRGGIYRYTSDSGTHRQLYCIKRTVSAG